jgi:hypothetical protein
VFLKGILIWQIADVTEICLEETVMKNRKAV